MPKVLNGVIRVAEITKGSIEGAELYCTFTVFMDHGIDKILWGTSKKVMITP